MSDNNIDNKNEEVAVVEETQQSQPINERTQYIIGAVSGVFTAVMIYISGRDLGVSDPLIEKIQQYAFLAAFVAFMLSIKKLEEKRNISMRKTRTAFMISIGVGVLVFLAMAITSS